MYLLVSPKLEHRPVLTHAELRILRWVFIDDVSVEP